MTAAKVFGVIELLEQILIDVDIKTLLLAQRVDRQWHRDINNSPKLRKALFFDFDHTRKHEHVLERAENYQHINPLLNDPDQPGWGPSDSISVLIDLQALPQ
ncbi:hypothetical protein B0A48_16672 [Cryoendolithus antarcticus]|uniref:F-box domain-containing protein n=1 Tax=Cryoendolithus antarcticus TaxID=1507870 RepID=A0A1V8SEL6_9PEZI|nr:hypothetical protein B0A48_16672 [Cryoendolithus antarcticus]